MLFNKVELNFAYDMIIISMFFISFPLSIGFILYAKHYIRPCPIVFSGHS